MASNRTKCTLQSIHFGAFLFFEKQCSVLDQNWYYLECHLNAYSETQSYFSSTLSRLRDRTPTEETENTKSSKSSLA